MDCSFRNINGGGRLGVTTKVVSRFQLKLFQELKIIETNGFHLQKTGVRKIEGDIEKGVNQSNAENGGHHSGSSLP